MSNASLPDRQLQAASNVAAELGALSPAERDFALRRMPVETLVEAYHAANVVPADLGAPVAGIDCRAIERAADDLRAQAMRLHAMNDFAGALALRAIDRAIRKALK